MPDTLEKTSTITIEEILTIVGEEPVIPCYECEDNGDEPNPAKWTVTHGNPACHYLFCDYHKQELYQFLSKHPDCGHKHILCKICDTRFGKNDVNVCPFKP